jgi:hypothetical protein
MGVVAENTAEEQGYRRGGKQVGHINKRPEKAFAGQMEPDIGQPNGEYQGKSKLGEKINAPYNKGISQGAPEILVMNQFGKIGKTDKIEIIS